jgi:hypothetical protein
MKGASCRMALTRWMIRMIGMGRFAPGAERQK